VYNTRVAATNNKHKEMTMNLNQTIELASNLINLIELIERLDNGTVVTKAEVKRLEPFIELHCWNGANDELNAMFSRLVVATGYED